ncbi:MAG TPA: glucose-6-phosphate dehydrogenase [Acidimicrobiales bacterium]|nr:glucose-6-phosphate dehydrogenase [Acidimicrobiales bacterium]
MTVEIPGLAVHDIDLDESVVPVAHQLDTVSAPPPLALVVFGASGDLAARKLLPAVASLADHGALPDGFTLVGVARTPWSDDEFRKVALKAVTKPSAAWKEVVKRFRYVAGEYGHPDTFDRLKQVLEDADTTDATAGNRLFYLATVPDLFATVAAALGRHGCATPGPGGSFARLLVEKPFGRDLAGAQALNATLHEAFDESSIFRIDHYMGKETVQNVLALRFANAVFEPVWNRRYIDNIQITVAEELGVEHRGGFYETAGALRDIVQNHVMQVLALTLMEPPAVIEAQSIRDEKVKLLQAVVIPTVDEAVGGAVRAQYTAGSIDGAPVPGYREEPDVDPHSRIETFVAMRLAVDNWRWAGVPVYIRTGKRLPKRSTEVTLEFQRVPHLAFGGALTRDLRPNSLILRIQPDDGICLRFGAKVPGEAFRVRSVGMDFSYAETFPGPATDGYERLLHDAMIGDATLFIRTDEVEQAWRITDPFLEAWAEDGVPLAHYEAGTWGPHDAELLLARDLRRWRDP